MELTELLYPNISIFVNTSTLWHGLVISSKSLDKIIIIYNKGESKHILLND